MEKNPILSKEQIDSEILKNVRVYITKTGRKRDDKLRPIIIHDNRIGGTYNVGKNASKRAKREQQKNK